MENSKQPLLSYTTDDPKLDHASSSFAADDQKLDHASSSFNADEDDMSPINGVRDFFREFYVETKKLWYLAGPSVFTSVCQYNIGAITQVFSGQLGTIQLAAFSVENSVIAAFSYGIISGMVSALETLCGQAYGAGNPEMLGIYMQRSWIFLNIAALGTMSIFIFATPVLRLFGQTAQISKAAGTFALLMIPQQFAYAAMLPVTKFLQAQSKVMVMAWIAVVALVLHTFFSWLLMLKLGWELVGAAVALNASWWFIAGAQLLFVFTGACGKTWSGFSMMAFQDLWGFVKLSLASALMSCLELWYTMALMLFAGYLKNAEIAVDALSICTNILGLTTMAALGFNAAVSVRVSNELGSGRPRLAKFASLVVGITTSLIGLFIAIILIISRKEYPAFFSNNSEVKQLVDDLTPLLGVSVVVVNLQYALQGVAIGAGWQAIVAYMNMGCYFLFGIPVSIIMGYKLDMGVKGIWYGMVSGISVQTFLLLWMMFKTNWNKEACAAGDRMKEWGGKGENNVEGILR